MDIDLKIFREELNRGDSPLAVYHSHRSSFQAIPASIDPMIISDSCWDSIALASDLCMKAMQGIVKLWRDPAYDGKAKEVFAELSGYESEGLRAKDDNPLQLATARLDLFFDQDVLKIIEANTTIPAMQAYSDIIRSAWLKSIGKDDGRSPNSSDLLASLIHLYQKHGGASPLPAIAIVARKGDSQIAELNYLKRIWERSGHRISILQPEDLSIKGGKLSTKAGDEFDIIYRHIFASRLDKTSDFAKACLRNRDFHIYNPLAAHLETKALFAELSRFLSERKLAETIGLSPAEQRILNDHLPWTRIIQQFADSDEQRRALDEWKSLDPKEHVIKGSSGYGGHKVFIGSEFSSADSQTRLKALLGSNAEVTWTDFLNYCLKASSETWIIQKRMHGQRMKHRFLYDTVAEQESYVDASIFVWSHRGPRGGASRFATDPIVNIGRGGGLLPLLLQKEYEALISPISRS